MGQSPSTSVPDQDDLPRPSEALDLMEEEILGELDISNDDRGRRIAQIIYDEGLRISNSDTNWIQVVNKDGMKLEKKGTAGIFAKSTIQVFRGEYTLSAPAQEFWEFLISDEGYKVLMPDLDLDTFERKPCNFSYKTECQLEQSFMKMPLGVTDRSYLVLNVYDKPQRKWACKSVFHSDYPGSTKHHQDGRIPTETGHERMFYLSFFSMKDGEEPGTCKLGVVQLMDLGGSIFESISNSASKSYFFDLKKSFKKVVKERYCTTALG